MAREPEVRHKNRLRMLFRALKNRSLPIGRSVVEAANISTVTKRLAVSGMRWSMEGGQAIKTIRVLILSGRFDGTRITLAGDNNAKPTRQALATLAQKAAMSDFHLTIHNTFWLTGSSY